MTLKKIVWCAIVVFVGLRAMSQEAAIRMTTSAAANSYFSFMLRADNETTVQIDYGNGVLVSKKVSVSISWIEDTLRGTDIKIYGNNINYLRAYNCSLSALDISNCATIKELDCSTNQITELNLHNNGAIKNLYIANNKLTAIDLSVCPLLERLEIGSNKIPSLDLHANTKLDVFSASFHSFTSLDFSYCPLLTRLDCRIGPLASINISGCPLLDNVFLYSNKLTSLDISHNTELTYLYCNYNSLAALDVKNNPKLGELNCCNNAISELDVSKNTALTRLFCYSNTISSLDVSALPKLTYLYCYSNNLNVLNVTNNTTLTDLRCYSNKIESIDVSNNLALTCLDVSKNLLQSIDISKNVLLTEFYCNENRFSTIDVSKNTALTKLNCGYNYLTTLDISQNTSLSSLYCYYNKLTFSALPLPAAKLYSYYYSGQKPFALNKQYFTNEAIDLSREATINGKTTVFAWKTKSNNTVLVENVDYRIAGGVTYFLKPQSDSVYCVLSNETFPSFASYTALRSSNVAIKIDPSVPQQQVIALTAGWNLISTYLRPVDSSIATIVSGLAITEIKTDEFFWRSNQPKELNLLQNISYGKAYWVYASSACTVTITGLISETTIAPTVTRSGWQLIGCPYQTATKLSSIFTALNCSVVKNLNGFWKPNNSLSSITSLEPGMGYCVKK